MILNKRGKKHEETRRERKRVMDRERERERGKQRETRRERGRGRETERQTEREGERDRERDRERERQREIQTEGGRGSMMTKKRENMCFSVKSPFTITGRDETGQLVLLAPLGAISYHGCHNTI